MEEMKQFKPSDTNTPPPATTFDEASLERSKNFVKALQELKNLRPQLYSAADYCEKSYLHSDQKQIVLDNLKDYAVRALVNAVDHLGTVAYKLTDLLEQQTADVSTMELKMTCMNQQFLTCQTYMDKEGLRQQQLLAIIPRHHKRYVLPNSVNKKVHFSPNVQMDPRQINVQARPRVHPSGAPGSKTLSWHLASGSEMKSSTKGTSRSTASSGIHRTTVKSPFHLLDKEEGIQMRASAAHQHLPGGNTAFGAAVQPTAATNKEPSITTSPKPMTPFRSFDSRQQQIVRAPGRSKSMLSAFFVKQKTPKVKAGTVS